MDTTKITLKINTRLAVPFHELLEQCYLKRDAFLHHIIRTQIPYLGNDLGDFRLSKEAKRYISGKLARADYKTMSIVVEKQTANELNEIIKRHNLVRDAFFNRLFLFLICPQVLLEFLDLPKVIGDRSLSDLPSMSISPLEAIAETVSDPLFYIREALSEANMEPIYRVALPESLHGLSCFLTDENVPGTPEHAQMREDSEKLLRSLFDENQ